MAAFLHDPVQPVNALTVGGITHRDALTTAGTMKPVARAGQLSPYASTNASSTLPIKPEIVLEGGNACPDGSLVAPAKPICRSSLPTTAAPPDICSDGHGPPAPHVPPPPD